MGKHGPRPKSVFCVLHVSIIKNLRVFIANSSVKLTVQPRKTGSLCESNCLQTYMHGIKAKDTFYNCASFTKVYYSQLRNKYI